MINKIAAVMVIFSLTVLSSISFAESSSWEKDFIKSLQKGKAVTKSQGGGLGYTPAEDIVLEQAIQKALEVKAPPCEVMKIAVDLKYSPYSTVKNIFGYGGELDLDQLCMCATESGINKQIVARSAADAASPLGEPIYDRDEIIQSQCLNEGLGYTKGGKKPPPIPPPIRPVPLSVASPT